MVWPNWLVTKFQNLLKNQKPLLPHTLTLVSIFLTQKLEIISPKEQSLLWWKTISFHNLPKREASLATDGRENGWTQELLSVGVKRLSIGIVNRAHNALCASVNK